ncbi:cytochrome P450 [Trifolium medium]|uniref:Cytochrome P450 n=1 Tax=Trifolium medium TaxID=97028 RepID=A0A392M3K0_9FABA|nr:cytochrome P450 [Trifolium medium]
MVRVVGNGERVLFWKDNWLGGGSLETRFPRLFGLAVAQEISMAEMCRLSWSGGGEGWQLRRRLFVWEEGLLVECCLLLANVVLQVQELDKWRWLLDPDGAYSVSSTYYWLTHQVPVDPSSHKDVVWNKLVPLKVSLFMWRLLNNRLPTKDNLIRREILDGDSALCSGACGKEETLSHLFFDCDFFGAIWYAVASWLGFSFVPPREANAHVMHFGGSLPMGHGVRNVLYLVWATCCWSIWKERNNHIFKVKALSTDQLVGSIKMVSWWWLKTRKKDFSFDRHQWWSNPADCLGIH